MKARTLEAAEWNNRLGGRVQPKEQMDQKSPHISETPERLGDRVLRKRVCGDGGGCKACECLDKCHFGQEFLKRGLATCG